MDTLVLFGTEVKAYDDGWTGGYLVTFGEPDLSTMRDVFTKADTNFDINPENDISAVYYHHGLDPVLKRKKLGPENAQIGIDDVGVWIKHQLDLRDPYEAGIHKLAQMGKLGWSSGTLPHLVERKAIEDNAHLVTSWPLGKDASYTPIPAHWRNAVGVGSIKSIADVESMSLEDAIKSLLKQQPEAQDPETPQGVGSAAGDEAQPKTETKKMEVHVMSEQTPQPDTPAEENEMKAALAVLQKQSEKTSETLNTVLKFIQDSPMIRKSGYFTEDGGAADPAIKSAGDLMLAIARKDVTRLTKVYGVSVKAHTERDGTTGGFYVPETVLMNLLPDLSLVSGVGNLVRRIPVSTPAGSIPMRDYSRSVTANVGQSASAAGSTSQGRAESGAYTEEQQYFEKIRWEVSDYASGYVKASRELVKDLPMIEALLRAGIEEDVKNKEEFSILRGSGAGQPQGVIGWVGTIGIAEDTDNTFAIADMDEMVSRHLVGDANKVAWVYHHGAYPNIAGFERGSSNYVMHNVTGSLEKRLNGYLQFMSQHLPAQGTSGYVVLGDWSRYLLFELEGLYIEMSEHADFLNGNVVWRFGKRQDGRPIMTSYVTLADNSTTLSPFVRLNNKT